MIFSEKRAVRFGTRENTSPKRTPNTRGKRLIANATVRNRSWVLLETNTRAIVSPTLALFGPAYVADAAYFGESHVRLLRDKTVTVVAFWHDYSAHTSRPDDAPPLPLASPVINMVEQVKRSISTTNRPFVNGEHDTLVRAWVSLLLTVFFFLPFLRRIIVIILRQSSRHYYTTW